MYRLELSSDAAVFYTDADPPMAKKIARAFTVLESTPRRHNNIKPLKGRMSDYLRFRIGDWRIVYRTDDSVKVVYVTTIRHRRDVYE